MEGPLKQRDIVTVPFPFSDQHGMKRRPAVVLSNDRYNEGHADVLVFAITSRPNDTSVQLRKEESGLPLNSAIRADAPLRIGKELVLGKIGSIAPATQQLLIHRFTALVD